MKTKVFDALKTAMRNKDTLSKGVLTLVKAALDSAEKEKGSTLTEQEEISVVNREIKQTNQALEGAQKANRSDLIEKEEAKLVLLKSFLPKQLSIDELINELKDNGIESGMPMGDAMKIAKTLFASKADGATLSSAVKLIISN